MSPIPDPQPGTVYDIEYRVVAHSNAAAYYYFTIDVEMFAFEENNDGTLLLVLTEECRKELSERYRSYVDMLTVDPDAIKDNPHVETVTQRYK